MISCDPVAEGPKSPEEMGDIADFSQLIVR